MGSEKMTQYYYLFELLHSYIDAYGKEGDPISETKKIGVYTTLNKAREAVERFRPLKGFSAHPDDFIISCVRCYTDRPLRREDLEHTPIYTPYYEYWIAEEECDFVHRGLYYTSQVQAQKVIDEWKTKNRHIKREILYYIFDVKLNKDSLIWNEGFDRE